MSRNLIKTYVNLVLERTVREADVTSGERVPFGSDDHVADLESRIADLTRWRDRQRKGSEARANYARLVGKLRSELRAAKRAAAKNASGFE